MGAVLCSMRPPEVRQATESTAGRSMLYRSIDQSSEMAARCTQSAAAKLEVQDGRLGGRSIKDGDGGLNCAGSHPEDQPRRQAMKKFTWVRALGLAAMGSLALGASAQEHTLKFHHLWPATSLAATKVIGPWCERIGSESKGRLKCQVLHAMSG